MKLAIALIALAACGGTARGLEAYRTDTQKLLDTRTGQIQSCYDSALKADAKAGGTVAIQFTVAKKTGEVTNATIDKAKTTAPDSVGGCVLEAVKGLKLDPPDRNEGQATFVYEFKPASSPT
ncbi:MAG: AgmX/PglI C-terminal domain-containing protein [Acidobacteriota bacterium]